MENTFATFNPITINPNPTMEEISNYYKTNKITLDDDYLNNMFGLKAPGPVTTKPPIKPTQPVPYNVKQMLANTGMKTGLHTTDPVTGISTFKSNPTSVDDRAKEALKFFVSKGLTKEQAAGIVGNLHAESGFKTGAVGDQGTSFGLAQWHNERGTNLKTFAKQKGTPFTSFGTQLEFLWHELQTYENKALKHLMTTKTVTEAARSFAHNFERMKTYNTKREEMANHYYGKF